MPDYKAMYFHLAGRMATAVEVMDTTVTMLESATTAMESATVAMRDLTNKLKATQLKTEEMYINDTDYEPVDDA